MDWMIAHRDHPFPDPAQIQQLCHMTTQSQVVNWTTNVRKRNLKATVENGKKTRHFVDFLFLAANRERQQPQAGADGSQTMTPQTLKTAKKSRSAPSSQTIPPSSAPPYRTTPEQTSSSQCRPPYPH
mmetsp:Transcript_20985/g.31823  ORF Transcript_20985/g.31823 Transcript_20985/m.31823 type:complete len:127 (-) Transcript_20985:85-465(-)